jgi:hypothetical protein
MPKNSKYSPLIGEVRKLMAEGVAHRKIAETLHKKSGIGTEHGLKYFIDETIREDKLKEEHAALSQECETVGIPIESVNHYWYKGENFSINVKNKTELQNIELFRKSVIEDANKYAPTYKKLKRQDKKEKTLFVIDPADAHFGKYSSKEETGESYNLSIAKEKYISGFDGLLSKGSYYDHEKIVIVGGNDVIHTDNPFRTTTSGTKQDTDGMWFESFNEAKWANIKIIEQASTISDVHFVHCPSNHDYQTGFFLAQLLQAWFRNNPNVTFDVSNNHRKYIQYGLNLIGMSHGDGAKEVDLPSAMCREAKQAWSTSEYAYWYLHHIHHKDKKARDGKKGVLLEKDGKGVSIINTGLDMTAKDFFHVEYLRSISAADGWHSRNMFQHSFSAMEGFIHHPIHGQISRLTHLFEQ